ncbi:MAG: hypothetical protein IKT09_05840 [Synergistes sp.]|nr:hypothetical protein [Synergistes sp.]
MTLKNKSQIWLGLILLSVLLLLDILFTRSLISSAHLADRERMERNLSRTHMTLRGEVRMLSAIAGNWAYSDKTWDFMMGANPDYPETYLNRAVLTELGVSSLIFIDNDAKVVFARDYSAPDDESSPESEIKAISESNGAALLRELPEDGMSGIVMRDDEPILFAVKHIRRSNKEGASAGALIATMPLSAKKIQNISNNVNFNFTVEPVTEREKEQDPPNYRFSDERDSSYIKGSTLIRDYAGDPAFWISGISPNTDVRGAERRLQKLFLALAAAALLLILLFGLFMKKQITNRIRKLGAEIEAATGNREDAHGITVDSKHDEITELQRTVNDSIAFSSFNREERNKNNGIELSVYKRFSEAGRRICTETLEDMATALWREDDRTSRSAILRGAREARAFAAYLGKDAEELNHIYLGSLFAKTGMLALPLSIRTKKTELSDEEDRKYKKYPIFTKDFMTKVALLRPAAQTAYCCNENWDGTGFPQKISGSEIPLSARICAVADEWNELTRPWPGRVLPDAQSVEKSLRSMAGSRLDPDLVEKFIEYLKNGSSE